MSTQLRFIMSNSPELEDGDTGESVHYLEREPSKKASFFLAPPKAMESTNLSTGDSQSPIDAPPLEGNADIKTAHHFSLNKPAHVYLDYYLQKRNIPFLFGGLEIISNSRSIEVYSISKDSKEAYLLTSRGSPVDTITGAPQIKKDIEWFIHVIVHPNGPGEIKRLKLKLLSLRSPKNRAIIQVFKMKGKIPSELETSLPTTTSNKNNENELRQRISNKSKSKKIENAPFVEPKNKSPSPSQNSLTSSDIQAAMTTFTLMSKSMEDRIQKTFIKEMNSTQETFNKQIQSLTYQNHALIKLIENQGQQINSLCSIVQLQSKTKTSNNDVQLALKKEKSEEVVEDKDSCSIEEKTMGDVKSTSKVFKDNISNENDENNIEFQMKNMREYWKKEKDEMKSVIDKHMRELTACITELSMQNKDKKEINTTVKEDHGEQIPTSTHELTDTSGTAGANEVTIICDDVKGINDASSLTSRPIMQDQKVDLFTDIFDPFSKLALMEGESSETYLSNVKQNLPMEKNPEENLLDLNYSKNDDDEAFNEKDPNFDNKILSNFQAIDTSHDCNDGSLVGE